MKTIPDEVIVAQLNEEKVAVKPSSTTQIAGKDSVEGPAKPSSNSIPKTSVSITRPVVTAEKPKPISHIPSKPSKKPAGEFNVSMPVVETQKNENASEVVKNAPEDRNIGKKAQKRLNNARSTDIEARDESVVDHPKPIIELVTPSSKPANAQIKAEIPKTDSYFLITDQQEPNEHTTFFIEDSREQVEAPTQDAAVIDTPTTSEELLEDARNELGIADTDHEDTVFEIVLSEASLSFEDETERSQIIETVDLIDQKVLQLDEETVPKVEAIFESIDQTIQTLEGVSLEKPSNELREIQDKLVEYVNDLLITLEIEADQEIINKIVYILMTKQAVIKQIYDHNYAADNYEEGTREVLSSVSGFVAAIKHLLEPIHALLGRTAISIVTK